MKQIDSSENPKPTVLIIDDLPINLALLFDYLESEAFRVLVAQSGANALLQLQRLKPDIILLDIKMPGLDGFEVCRLIKANADLCEIPIIFLTALDDVVDKVRGFELGAVDYITKPVDHVEVLARLRTHLMLRDLQDRLRRQLDLALRQVQERTAELAYANAALTALNGSYKAEIAQRQRHEQEKDSLFMIIAQQTEQWRTLSHLLSTEAEPPRTALALALNAQASQNLDLAWHAFDRIARSFAPGECITETMVSHFHHAVQILQSTQHYLAQINQRMPQSAVDLTQGQTVLATLTAREREVFQLLIDGASITEIGSTLLLSEGSVRTYRARLMEKLGIDSFVGLIKFAIKHGLTAIH